MCLPRPGAAPSSLLLMSLKIFTFACEQGHLFEGWLRDGADWEAQARAGELVCPICGSSSLERRPDAPNFAPVKGTVRTDVDEDAASRRAESERRQASMQGQALAAMRKLAQEAEDVGARFPDEVRSMRDGLSEKRLVRGVCSPDEAKALVEEGCSVMPLPDAVAKPQN